MPDLIAQGPAPQDRWRREVPEPASRAEIVIGRSDADWEVPWDPQISRQHIRVIPQPPDRLEIICLPAARNPVFHAGETSRRFTLVPGDHFVIGKTTFTLANRPGAQNVAPDGDLTEHAYDHAALRRRHFSDASSRIEMLARLPDLITSSGSDQELLVRVTSVLLNATPAASAVAVVRVIKGRNSGQINDSVSEIAQEPNPNDAGIQVLHYDSRIVTNSATPVSAKLVRKAVEKTRERDECLDVWTGFA